VQNGQVARDAWPGVTHLQAERGALETIATPPLRR
jgi:hypothetical protein